MRRLVASLLEWGEGLVDESLPAADIHAYLERALPSMAEAFQSRREGWTARMCSEYMHARDSVLSIGIGAPAIAATVEPVGSFLPEFRAAAGWLEGLPEKRVVSRTGIVSGAGSNLLSILLRGDERFYASLQENLERLLRQVEVRRQDALTVAGAGPEAQWIEKHDIAILFLEAARQFEDVRYFNAVLKLNDWAFKAHRAPRARPRTTRYIYALAEQEAAIGELVKT
jgi:hypothetical protein